jgi:cyclophilin family peptidyl-prolyl cis-trans isomerase/HEAT repeat protein
VRTPVLALCVALLAAQALSHAEQADVVARLAHADVGVRVEAVRAAGRLEDPALIPSIAPLLADDSIDVRVEAAVAIAQVAATAEDAWRVSAILLRRLAAEQDGMVIGTLAASLGRLPHGDAESLRSAAAILAQPRSGLSSIGLLGVARGAESLARRSARLEGPAPPVLVDLLRQLSTTGTSGAGSTSPVLATRIRRLATQGLASVRGLDAGSRARLSGDADEQIRRLVVLGWPEAEPPAREDLRRWLSDASMLVRHAAVRRYLPRHPDLIPQALADPHPHVRTAAIDALGAARMCAPCEALVTAPPADAGRWHIFAHALVALARTDPGRVRHALEQGTRDRVWQVRMYTARAAGEAGEAGLLRTLARDPHPNVREAAIVALGVVDPRGSDDLRLEALESDDYQLVLTAARAFDGVTLEAAAVRALAEALDRISLHGFETSRDTRLAIIDRLETAAGERIAREALRRRLQDFDTVVAHRAAGALALAGDTAATAAPVPLPAEPPPTVERIAELDGRRVVLTLEDGADVVIRLDAGNAPVNASRFARQVELGEWDGLTFHRVEPGFVVQGGSPGANEYAGAARHTRDERSGLSHVRGTVGISTRGRDTGDGQIFVNLVDNPRLDHAYTIIGAVVSGMEHVDDMLEGAVITRARLAPRQP